MNLVRIRTRVRKLLKVQDELVVLRQEHARRDAELAPLRAAIDAGVAEEERLLGEVVGLFGYAGQQVDCGVAVATYVPGRPGAKVEWDRELPPAVEVPAALTELVIARDKVRGFLLGGGKLGWARLCPSKPYVKVTRKPVTEVAADRRPSKAGIAGGTDGGAGVEECADAGGC